MLFLRTVLCMLLSWALCLPALVEAAVFSKLLPSQNGDCLKTPQTECDPRAQALHQQQLYREMQDSHKGETCILIANGPSLNKVDWSFLHNYNVVIGLNKIHYGFERFNLTVSHHISVNPLVAEQMKSDLITEFDCRTIKLQRYDIMKFLPCDTAHYNILPFASPSQARTPRCGPFCKDITRGIQEGWTVTYAGLQIAYYIGCQQVIIVGMDHNFEQRGKANQAQRMRGPDPNHFDPRYFQNHKWHTADLKRSEEHYKIARRVFEAEGREIIDATIDGKCQIFKKANFREVLDFSP